MKTGTFFLTSFKNFLCFILLVLPVAAFAADDFQLSASTSVSNDGSLNLSWNLPENTSIELQQASQPASQPDNNNFQTIYRGNDTATVITGLSNGKYLFRARLVKTDGSHLNWTLNTELEVKHHSLTKAFSFFTIGAIVFLATLVLLIKGTKKVNPPGSHA